MRTVKSRLIWAALAFVTALVGALGLAGASLALGAVPPHFLFIAGLAALGALLAGLGGWWAAKIWAADARGVRREEFYPY